MNAACRQGPRASEPHHAAAAVQARPAEFVGDTEAVVPVAHPIDTRENEQER